MKLFKPNVLFPVLAFLSYMYIGEEGLLSKNGYRLISLSFILLTTIIYYFLHKAKLKGSFILKKRNRPITNRELLYILLLVVFSKGDPSYSLMIITICYFISLIVIGLITSNIRPETVSFTNKTVFFNDYRLMEMNKLDITAIKYIEADQKIAFEFKEGIDNFDLLRAEYDLTELMNFLKALSQSCEQEIEVSDILTNYYFLKVQ